MNDAFRVRRGLNFPIENLHLPAITFLQLKRAGINTYQELLEGMSVSLNQSVDFLQTKTISYIVDHIDCLKIIGLPEEMSDRTVVINGKSFTLDEELFDRTVVINGKSFTLDVDQILFLKNKPIECLDLSTRVYRSLRRVCLSSVYDVIQLIITTDLKNIRNFGYKSEIELFEKLHAYISLNFYENINSHCSPETEVERSLVTNDCNEFNYLLNPPANIMDVNISVLDKYISSDLLSNLESIGVSTIGEMVSLTKKFYDFLYPQTILIDKTIEALQEKINSKVENGSIHKDVIIQSNSIEKLVKYEPKTFSEKTNLLDVLISILKYPSLDSELQEVFSKITSREINLFLQKILEKRTLGDLGDEEGVTRERIRQLIEKAENKIIGKLQSLPLTNIQTACHIALDLDNNLSIAVWNSTLIDKNLISAEDLIHNRNSFEILRALIMNKRTQPFIKPASPKIHQIIESGTNLSVGLHQTLSSLTSKDRHEIDRTVRLLGGINVNTASQIIGCSLPSTKEVLNELGYAEIINEWFSFSERVVSTSQHLFRNASLLMMKACGSLPLDSFCDGLRRYVSRYTDSIAPKSVITHYLNLMGFVVDDDTVFFPGEIDIDISASEKLFIDLFYEKGPILSQQEVSKFFVDNGLSASSAQSKVLPKSPIVQKIGIGYYTLRGAAYSSLDFENTKARQETYNKDPIVTYGIDSVVRYQFTITSWAMSGVVSVCRSCLPLPDLSPGWEIFTLNPDKPSGKITRDDSLIWGIGPAFKKLEIMVGDRVELAFDTKKRIVILRMINDR